MKNRLTMAGEMCLGNSVAGKIPATRFGSRKVQRRMAPSLFARRFFRSVRSDGAGCMRGPSSPPVCLWAGLPTACDPPFLFGSSGADLPTHSHKGGQP